MRLLLLVSLALVAPLAACKSDTDTKAAPAAEPAAAPPTAAAPIAPAPVAPPTTPAPEAPPAAATPPTAPASPATVNVRVDDADAVLAVVVEATQSGKPKASLRVPSVFKKTECEQTEANEEALPGSDTLHAVRLFCINGEDVVRQDSLTALVHLDGAAPKVLWQGQGTYGSDFGCEELDVFSFKVESTEVVVMREESAGGKHVEGLRPCPKRKLRSTKVATVALSPT